MEGRTAFTIAMKFGERFLRFSSFHFKFIDYTISGTEYNFVLKLANPTQHPTYIEFIDLEQYMINRKDPEEFEDLEKESTAASKPVSISFLTDFALNTKDT